MHREITLDQGLVRYRELGDGPPVVFVHGLFVDGRLWDGVAQQLRGVRAIVPDWPLGSHQVAMSRKADLSARGVARLIDDFLGALHLDDVALVGNDSGGAISQLVAAHHPRRIGRLVLTNCDAFENFPPKMFRYLGLVARVPFGMSVLAQSMRMPLALRMPFAFGALTKRPIDKALLRDWVRPLQTDRGVRRDARKFLLGMDPEETLAAAERLTRFRRPALIAWGTDDPFFRLEYGERLAKVLPDARLERIEDARAFVPLDQPLRVARSLQEFIDATGGSQPGGSVPVGIAPGTAAT
jgi:pimeloyl-ACP methyl ester carboxylesterase